MEDKANAPGGEKPGDNLSLCEHLFYRQGGSAIAARVLSEAERAELVAACYEGGKLRDGWALKFRDWWIAKHNRMAAAESADKRRGPVRPLKSPGTEADAS